jgi:hypothetical protein
MTVHRDNRDNLRINNQKLYQVSKILFCHETLDFSGVFCVHHQEILAVQVVNGTYHAGYLAGA